MIRGYRGFVKEFSRTGSARALLLQVRTGVAHIVARARRGDRPDAVELFLRNYRDDGVRLPDEGRDALRLDAQRCTACGLCSLECARVGGAPPLDPLDAVAAAARLEVDVVRLGLETDDAAACAACAACDRICPVHVPIARVQADLAALARSARESEASSPPAMAHAPQIG